MIDKEGAIFLESNVKGLMQECITAMNIKMAKWREDTEFATLREGDIRVFAQLRGQPFTVSQLGRLMGITRQAVHLAVQRLQQEGMVNLVDSPADRKQKIIEITEKGQRFRHLVAKHLQHQEQQICQQLGQTTFDTLRDALLELQSFYKQNG
ncbi:MarR family transcriptional regulator [Photobacterium sagamiensis]|uniref:MarR family winged helix-turn-helix transcriptional regulator n=1 Tax=Photobacterium sagamiensis TaxID=2910241 RepID=UPI003D0BE737